MKWIRQKSPSTDSEQQRRVIVDNSTEIILDSKRSLKLPLGTEFDRPQTEEYGQIRFINTTPNWNAGDPITSGYYEAYTLSGWQKIRMFEPTPIKKQKFAADGIATQFGPLDNEDDLNPASFANNENSIMVYIENVYQIPGENYQITQVGQDYFVDFGGGSDPAPPDGKFVFVLHNFDK